MNHKQNHSNPTHAFNPLFLFGSIWVLQIIGQLYFTNVYNPLSHGTWTIVITAILFFALGTLSIQTLSTHQFSSDRRPQTNFEIWINQISTLTMFIFLFISIFIFIAIYTYLFNKGFQIDSFELLRIALIQDMTDDRGMTSLLKIFFFGVGLSLFFLSHLNKNDKRKQIFIFAVGTIAAILTTGRLALLLLTLGTAYILHSQQTIKIRGLCMIGLLFILSFFGLAILINKGDNGLGWHDQLSWNIQVYLFGSLPNFDHYVILNKPQIDGGALLPNTFRPILTPIIGLVESRPPVNPFIVYPIESNTFTFLFPIYHDLGLPGIAGISAALGALHQWLYRWQFNDRPLSKYIYSISIYPLFMSIFEDAYFSSPGFWVTLIIIPILFYAIYRFKCIFN